MISMVSITIRSLSISRSLVVAMVSIAISVMGIRVGMISVITIGRVAIRSLSISRPLVVAMVSIAISMVSITIVNGMVGMAIGNSMMAGISFRLSCDSCKQ